MMSVALNAITQFLSLPLPGADTVDYLEPNELQLEEPFPFAFGIPGSLS